MTSRAELAAAVAAAPAGSLLPDRRASDAAAGLALTLCDVLPLTPPAGVQAPPSCEQPEDVGPGPWLVVARSSGGDWLGLPLMPVVATEGAPLRVRRALPGDGVAAALLDHVASPRALPVVLGDFVLSSLDVGPLGPRACPGERALDVDQTHDSVVVDEAAVVKWAVHLSPREGDAPAARALTQLSAVGFDEIPAPLGLLQWRGPRAGEHGRAGPLRTLLASVSGYLPGARDGWDWCVDDLSDQLAGRLSWAAAIEPSTALGGLVGRLHLAFASRTRDNPYPVRRSSPAAARGWRDDALATLREALDVTAGDSAARLAGRAASAARLLDSVGDIRRTPVTMVHGDLHVGQVLRHDGGYAVNDFDGNPVLSPEQQAAMAPPARDVAGMLQSLDHVGRIVDRRTEGAHATAVAQWIESARYAFLAAYRQTLDANGRGELLDDRLLLPFQVEQELREHVYAARHLPGWAYVPDAALGALLEGVR